MYKTLFVVIFMISSLTSFAQQDVKERELQLIEDPIYLTFGNRVIYQNYTSWKMLHADSASLLKSHKGKTPYCLDKDAVYVNGIRIEADTTAFEIMNPYSYRSYRVTETPILWKSKSGVYLNDTLLSQYDSETFSLIGYYNIDYTKDKNGIYFRGEKMEDVDVESFRLTGDRTYYYRDTLYIYENGKRLKISGEYVMPVNDCLVKTKTKVYTHAKVLCKNIDAASLKSLSRFYSMDKNNVYYVNGAISPLPADGSAVRVYDWVNCTYAAVGDKLFWRDENAKKYKMDARTFGIYPGSDDVMYDKRGAFHSRWNDSKKVLEHITYPFKYSFPFSVDDIEVTKGYILIYKGREFYDLTEGSNGKMLANLTDKEKKSLQQGNLWQSVEKATPLENNFLSINGNIHYNTYKRPKLAGIDPETFESLSHVYCKDKNGVYEVTGVHGESIYDCIQIEGADPKTFEVREGDYACDKNSVYSFSQKLEKISPIGFRALAVFIGYRMGCSQDTSAPFDYYLYVNKDGYWLLSHNSEEFLGTEFPKLISSKMGK